MAEKKKYTADDVIQAIRDRYRDQQRYAVFVEVANGTGARCSSWVDVAVVHLWPSDGLIREAFEVKVSRSDFLRELAVAKKNQWAKDAFHCFSYATAPGVVKALDEIPEGCGWFEVTAGGLRQKKAPMRRENPKCNDSLVAAFARAAAQEAACGASRIRADVLANEPTVGRARQYQAAVERFLREAGDRTVYSTADEVYSALRCANLDKDLEELREATLARLRYWQEHMRDLFWYFAALAFVGFEEEKQARSYIVHQLGAGELSKRVRMDAHARMAKTGEESKDFTAIMRQIMMLIPLDEPQRAAAKQAADAGGGA